MIYTFFKTAGFVLVIAVGLRVVFRKSWGDVGERR